MSELMVVPLRDRLLLLGDERKTPLQVWCEGRLVTLTRLPGGRAVLPPQEGRFQVRDAETSHAKLVIDDRLTCMVDGFHLEAPDGAEVHVWPISRNDASTRRGLLSGAAPTGSGQGRLDLRKVEAPYRVIHYAVQVRKGNAVGPVQIVCHRPEPKPFKVVVDHDAGRVGSRTHVDFRTELSNSVDVHVKRWIRQLDRTDDAVYQVQKPDTRISFDDLLHGDLVTMAVDAPFAIGSGKKALAQQTFRYQAVPRPELLPTGAEERLDYKAGVELLRPKAYDAHMAKAVGFDLGTFTWANEWPTTAGKERSDLPSALRAATGQALPEVDADVAAMTWWLRLVESGQDPKSAIELRRGHQIDPTPETVDATRDAVKQLDAFPLNLLRLLGSRDVADELEPHLTRFQDSLDIEPMAGDEVLALHQRVQDALHRAVMSWKRGLEKQDLHWLDGTLAPLDRVDGIEALAQRALDDPAGAEVEIIERRGEIANALGAPSEASTDIAARRDLLHHHIEATRTTLARLATGLQAIGLKCPDRSDVEGMEGMARWTSRVARSMVHLGHKADAVPLRGPGFFAEAVDEARVFARGVHPTLSAWDHDGVPQAMAMATRKLLEQLGPADGLARLDVWARFTAGSDTLLADLDALAQSTGAVGERARLAVNAFGDAHRSRDPAKLSEAVTVYHKVEGEIRSARTAWERVLGRIDPSMHEILGGVSLETLPEWDAIRDAIVADAEALKGRAAEALPDLPVTVATSLERLLGDGSRIDRIVERAEAGGSHQECASIVSDHDRLRRDVISTLGGDDPFDAIDAAHRQAVMDAARTILDARLPRDDAVSRRILDFVAPAGWKQVQELHAALENGEEDLDALATLSRTVAENGTDPWRTAVDTILGRLQAAEGDLVRYLRSKPAGWDQMVRSDDGAMWVVETVDGLTGARANSFVVNLRPGTKRLVTHTLKEALLWIA